MALTDIQATAANPLITGTNELYGTMPFSKLTAKDMQEAVMEGIKLQNQEIDAITNQRSNPTFENTIVALDRSGQVLHLPAPEGNIVSTTGCGDSFMAALAWAYLQGSDLERSARAGLAASTITMASADTINPAMSEEALLAHL